MNSSNVTIIESEQFKNKYPKIMDKIKTKKYKESNIDEINSIYKLIIGYIKSTKRKIYGGYALDKLLVAKNKSYALYDETDIPDIDFYSPDPLEDLYMLCDKLHEAGFKSVVGQEAQHRETYSIFVNYQLYCDISYFPANIYNKVKFIQIDGFNIVHPWFMMIDYFRMLTDPMMSYWRLEKHYVRYLKLRETYPLPIINKPLEIASYSNNKINEAINILFDFITTKNSLILCGFYAYNYYLHESQYQKSHPNYSYVNIPYLEIYSNNYIPDGLDIIEYISKLDIGSKIIHKEFYPLYQFYGYNVVFYYVDGENHIPILYLYSTNKKCIPFKTVKLIKFDNLNIKNPQQKPNSTINIGSFDLNMLQALIILLKVRIDDDNEWNDIIYRLINGYETFNKYYLKNHKITMYDESIFERFVVECIGETIDPNKERRLLMQARKKLGKPLTFRYEPPTSKKSTSYVFLNSSGNTIKREINLKLLEKNRDLKIEDEIENDEKQSGKHIDEKKSDKINNEKLIVDNLMSEKNSDDKMSFDDISI